MNEERIGTEQVRDQLSDRWRVVGVSMFTALAGFLVVASVAYACSATPSSVSGYMTVTPNGGVQGIATNLKVAGECLSGQIFCGASSSVTSVSGPLRYHRCADVAVGADPDCFPVFVEEPESIPPEPDQVLHTGHNHSYCNNSSTELADNADANLGPSNHLVTITKTGTGVSTVNGQGQMPASLTKGNYIVCADVFASGSTSQYATWGHLWNYFTVL